MLAHQRFRPRAFMRDDGPHHIFVIELGALHEGHLSLARAAKAGTLDPEALSEAQFGGCLQTAGMPDPDLIIRTSGEQRLSNFLLWQAAYAEFVFMDVLWPDFSAEDLRGAVAEFHRRERRYGLRS